MKRLAIAIAVMVATLYTPASALSDATKINNGAKLVFKEGSDSLFYVYGDENGAVQLVYGDGEDWDEEQVVSGRDYPAIAADSTDKRWVAVHQSYIHTGDLAVQEVYFHDETWSAETLYSGQGDYVELGPPSIAGASSTTTGIVYIAFLVTPKLGGAKSVVLTKYNGTAAASCIVATGSYLGDPAVAVEPYNADSARVHITWEDNGSIRYAIILDPMGLSTFGSLILRNGSLANETAHHPSINTERGLVVVAWAQGSPPEVYARQRATDGDWQNAVNQSGTPNDSSDYPTIAVEDTRVAVAWEETRSASDHDIVGYINFTLIHDRTIFDSDTISSYPHIVLQYIDEETIYLHTVWSEPDSVGYVRINLVEAEGEGQQSASSGPILTEPSLAACLPNPFHSHTQISYALPAASNVTLQVYDATGRPVRTLANGLQNAGTYSVSWDARDTEGKQVPCGVYFYRLDTPGFLSVKQAVVTR